MRKRLITPSPQAGTPHGEVWIDLDRIALVEVTSEEKEYPVESALVPGETRGWRADSPGTQTVRLIFDQPQRLKRIALAFAEPRRSVPKSLFCDGLRMVGAHFERLCASSGILALLIRYARSRNIKLTSRASRFLNWSSCLTSVEDRLAPRSRACGCLDSPRFATHARRH